MNLPSEFLKELKTVLGQDAEKYKEMFDQPAFRGISVNRLKITPERLLPLLPFAAWQSPFYKDGYYIPADTEGIGAHPLHHAGAFYVQEPSAASAVSLLDVQKGEKILDLCAAPGGKSSQIASLLGGTGLIWSNEVVKNRSRILLSNFERMGISAGVVSSCRPEILCSRLEGYFDKVLVDAPCSGEGMFRKNHDAVAEWSLEHVTACANRQISILQSAAAALREGGVLVYSTCTFSYQENEGVVQRLLEACPELEPYDMEEPFGRKTRFSNAVRITPMEGGEGHFAARFRKKGNNGSAKPSGQHYPKMNKDIMKLTEKFLNDIFWVRPELIPVVRGDKLYLVPDNLPDTDGLNVIRSGVLAGVIVKNRIEPEHALFTSTSPSALRRVLALSADDKRTDEFLSGNEIDCDGENGYTGVAVEGMITGFGKCSGGRLKNKYPKGLRR